MKIKMNSDEMNVLIPLSDVAENGIQVCLGEDVKLEDNITVEVSVKIKRDEVFDERETPVYISAKCTPDECFDCHVVACPVYQGYQTFEERWGK